MVAIIGGTTQRVALETTQRIAIDNEQILEISAFEANQHKDLDLNYGSVIRRHDPTPIYNCHGLTFASRRTGIYESSTLRQILAEDKYVEVSRHEVIPGDTIIYFDESNDFEHSGIVIKPPSEDNVYVPFVCSKWAKYAEVLHWATNCPYSFSNVKYYRTQL